MKQHRCFLPCSTPGKSQSQRRNWMTDLKNAYVDRLVGLGDASGSYIEFEILFLILIRPNPLT
jgi:hypothetical protein